jgi:hypothetical protein
MNSDLEKFYSHPLIRGLIQLVPSAGVALDSAIMAQISELQRKRLRIFFDKLSQEGLEITNDQINDNDFIHAYLATSQAVLRTHQKDKIKLFANLFKKYANSRERESLDDYEDWLKLLDEVSDLEFRILRILQRFEKWQDRLGYHKRSRDVTVWEDFLKSAAIETNLSTARILSLSLRVQRTGLLEPMYQTMGGKGTDECVLTDLYIDFLEALGLSAPSSANI